MIALALVACSLDLTTEPPPEPATPWTIPDLWSGAAPSGTRLTVEAVVISPRATHAATFYVQHAGGGPYSGLQVHVGDGIHEWPPPVGTPVAITGTATMFAGGPTMWLDEREDLEVLGPPVEPEAPPFTDDPAQVWSLVTVPALVVTSSVDPAGIASIDLGWRIRPDFGVPTPGWNRAGALVGVQALAFALLMRTPDDWSGDWEGDPPVAVADVSGLQGLVDGTPVAVSGLGQATPWSRGDRYALLQDASGAGVWVDAEGFGAPDSVEGDVGDWLGEVRYGGDGPRLRVWTDPVPTGVRAPIHHAGDPLAAPENSLVTTSVAGLLPVGPKGDRYADPWLLDDRFVPLDQLPDPALITGATRVDGAGVLRLAVLEAE